MKNNKKIYIIAFLSILFIINTVLVILGCYEPVDMFVKDVLMRLYSSTTDKVMNFFTFCGSTLWIIIFATLLFGYFLFKKKNKHAYSVASLIIISTVINNVLKLIIRRERPAYMPEGLESSFSYPSGHTMASTTIYGFLIYLIIKSHISKGNKVLFTLLLSLLILMVMSSRIYLGAHYFSDVVGGCLLSVIIILVFDVINDKKKLI